MRQEKEEKERDRRIKEKEIDAKKVVPIKEKAKK